MATTFGSEDLARHQTPFAHSGEEGRIAKSVIGGGTPGGGTSCYCFCADDTLLLPSRRNSEDTPAVIHYQL